MEKGERSETFAEIPDKEEPVDRIKPWKCGALKAKEGRRKGTVNAAEG